MDAAQRIARIIATEINANAAQVVAATQLLDGGATVPFVARYRKEVTGGLDDTQLRMLSDRLSYLREMEARRESILGSIREQGKLTDDLARAIAGADTKAALEDIYLPFKPKRRTKAMIARENGLEPLLRAIQEDRGADPKALASIYVTEAVPDQKSALDGARDILVEELSENATLLGRLRDFMRTEAFIAAKLVAGKEDTGAKFSDYFDHREAWAGIPAHRALAILRAAKEEVAAQRAAEESAAAEAARRAEAGPPRGQPAKAMQGWAQPAGPGRQSPRSDRNRRRHGHGRRPRRRRDRKDPGQCRRARHIARVRSLSARPPRRGARRPT